jgi:acyl dehydratase
VETDPLYERVSAHLADPPSDPVPAWDPVNQPMIRHWCDAMGDELPIYTDTDAARAAGHPDVVAPPASLQAWTMPGLRMRGFQDGTTRAQAELVDAGYVAVVATNCEQTYHRYLTLGDHLYAVSRLDSVSTRKRTALGEGYFLTSVTEYRDQHGELVGEMSFRTLWFKPAGAQPARAHTSERPS